MKDRRVSTTPKSATKSESAATVRDGDLCELTDGIAQKYGYSKLMSSIGQMMKLGASKQKIAKAHINRVSDTTSCNAREAVKTVIACYKLLIRMTGKVEVDSSDVSDILSTKVVSKPVQPGKIGLLVSNRPDYSSTCSEGLQLPMHRWEYMKGQAETGLRLTEDTLHCIGQLEKLPKEMLDDKDMTDPSYEGEVESDSDFEPISHRLHLKQFFALVKKATDAGLSTIYGLFKMDGTGRFHDFSRYGHQGPAGIRSSHSADKSRLVTLKDLKLWAWFLTNEYGIDYKQVANLLDIRNFSELVRDEDVSLNSYACMYKFLKATRTGHTDYLLEVDMNLSLGFIKALFMRCVTSAKAVGALCGWLIPDTWQAIARATDSDLLHNHLTAIMRKITKAAGTPGGYGAKDPTKALAILGLKGAKLGVGKSKVVINKLDDLKVETFADNGTPIPKEEWDYRPLEEVEKFIKPQVLEAMRRYHSKNSKSALALCDIVMYALELSEANSDAMNEILPCLEAFDETVLPLFKGSPVKELWDMFGFHSVIPNWKLSEDKKDVFDFTTTVRGNTSRTRFIRPVKKKGVLSVGPYIVFMIESSALVKTWLRTRYRVPVQKAVHDALLVPIQFAHVMNKVHGESIIEAVRKFGGEDFAERCGIDTSNDDAFFDRVRTEHNVFGLPNEDQLNDMFPDKDFKDGLEVLRYQAWLSENR